MIKRNLLQRILAWSRKNYNGFLILQVLLCISSAAFSFYYEYIEPNIYHLVTWCATGVICVSGFFFVLLVKMIDVKLKRLASIPEAGLIMLEYLHKDIKRMIDHRLSDNTDDSGTMTASNVAAELKATKDLQIWDNKIKKGSLVRIIDTGAGTPGIVEVIFENQYKGEIFSINPEYYSPPGERPFTAWDIFDVLKKDNDE